jgi:hypothetical protein
MRMLEAVQASFIVPCRHWPGRTEETLEKLMELENRSSDFKLHSLQLK